MGQYDPREHGPLQAAVFCPAVAPTRPAAHGPLHALLLAVVDEPNLPAVQGVGDAEPAPHQLPVPHALAVADVEPEPQ